MVVGDFRYKLGRSGSQESPFPAPRLWPPGLLCSVAPWWPIFPGMFGTRPDVWRQLFHELTALLFREARATPHVQRAGVVQSKQD